MRTGAPWRDLPSEYGPWQTVYGLFHRCDATAPGLCCCRTAGSGGCGRVDHVGGHRRLHELPGPSACRLSVLFHRTLIACVSDRRCLTR
ncbi:transposase [Streptomyces cinerochromogenes]|uniref:transposase n=1 Tax=Streptomyces cinerochromogenes TaxID=66422 RepID=UPI0036AFD1E9